LVPEAVAKMSKADIHDMLMLHNNTYGDYFSDEELAMLRAQERSLDGNTTTTASMSNADARHAERLADNRAHRNRMANSQSPYIIRTSTSESKMISAADNSTNAKGMQRSQDAATIAASSSAPQTVGVLADNNMLSILSAIAANTKATAEKEMSTEDMDQKNKNDALLDRMQQKNSSSGFFSGSFFNSSKIANANQIASGM
jgi:hypothetical protein